MIYSVAEVFQSIQGEGAFTGTPVNFIRLAGCPNGCTFCDTDYAARECLTQQDIFAQLVPYLPVVITGGEPLAQPILPLVDILVYHNFKVHLETSGVKAIPELARLSWTAVSPKKGIPVVPRVTSYGPIKFDEAKWLIPEWEYDEIDWDIAQTHFLQPVNTKDKVNLDNVQKCLSIIYAHPDKRLRLSVQLHKLIGVQ